MIGKQIEQILRPALDAGDKGMDCIEMAGMSGSEKALVTWELARISSAPLVVVLPSMKDVEIFTADLALFGETTPEEAATLFPAYNILPYKAVSYHAETSARRIRGA